MASHSGNGRNVIRPDENRPSWVLRSGRSSSLTRIREDEDRQHASEQRYTDRDRYERDRERDRGPRWGTASEARMGSHWEDDRDESMRGRSDWSTERYGQGQSGYGAGRRGDDRSIGMRDRGANAPSYYDRESGMGLDERFTGRGYWQDQPERRGGSPERYGAQGGYGAGSGFEERTGYQRQVGQQQTMYGYGQQRDRDVEREHGAGCRPACIAARVPRATCAPTSGSASRSTRRLSDDDQVDASEIEVTVKDGEGDPARHGPGASHEAARGGLRRAPPGVKDVQNQIRVLERQQTRGNLASGSMVGKSETRRRPATSGTAHERTARHHARLSGVHGVIRQDETASCRSFRASSSAAAAGMRDRSRRSSKPRARSRADQKGTSAAEEAEALPWRHLRKDDDHDRHRHVC
jgi:hypothetical protein